MGWFTRNKDYPAFYKDYLEQIKEKGYSKDIISLDMETSHIDIKKADILSFGSVHLKERKILIEDEVHYFFKSDHYELKNTVIHEILPHHFIDDFQDKLPAIMKHIGNKRILGHFVEFDVGLINHQLKKLNLPRIKNPTIDTLPLAMKHDGIHDYSYANREDYTLYALCKRFDIPVEKTHDALEDAYLTALLYLHLTREKV